MAVQGVDSIHEMKLPKIAFNSKFPEYKRMEARSHLLLGIMRPSFESPRPGEQEGHLLAALKLEPNNAFAHYCLAKLYMNEVRYSEAKEAFLKAAQFGDGELKKKSEMMLYTFPKAASPKP